MSGLRSRSSLTPTKVFLLSGLPGGERLDLAKKIKQLGGKYFADEDFKSHCTHVVCGKLTRSEKFLGACATGKWVLHPDYIRESVVAKDWLDEEQFEWCDDHVTNKMIQVIPLELAYASRRWRFMLGDQNRAFTGWKVAVVVGANRAKALKRLLVSGGAEVIPMKIPVKNPEKVANSIGYIFVSEQKVPAVAHLLEYGVLCIKPEFIGDYLIKDPPADPMDYLVQVGAGDALGPNSSQESDASFMMASQISLPLSDPSSELDGKVPSSSSQQSTEPNNEATVNIDLTSDVNHVACGADDDVVIDSFQTHSSKKMSKTIADKAYIPVAPSVIHASDQDVVTPGPSGAASQTGPSQNKNKDVLKSGVSISQSQKRSTTAPRQRTPVDVSNVSQISVQGNWNIIYVSQKSPTPKPNNSKKATDETKVKRTRTKIVNNSQKQEQIINSSKVDSHKFENDMNVKDLINGASDETTQIRTSGRLKHRKSEPVWKDLVPKKRSSTEKMESTAHIKRSSMEKEENKPVKQKENNTCITEREYYNVETDEVLKETVTNIENNDCVIVDVENVSKSLSPKEKVGRQKQKSLTELDWLKHKPVKVAKEMTIKTTETDNPDNVVKKENSISTSTVENFISAEMDKANNVVKKENSIFTSTVEHLISTNACTYSTAESVLNDTIKQKPRTEIVSEMKITPKAYTVTNKAEERNTSIGENDVNVVEKGLKGVICSSKLNRSETTKADNVYPSTSASAMKKKRSRQDADLQSILKDIKRQKVSHCTWRPTVLALDPSPESSSDTMIMPMTLTEIIHSSLEEKLSHQTAILDDLSSKITGKYMPQSKTLHAIMVNLLLGARNDLEANKAYQVLMKILHLHPPTSPGIQEVYRKSLCTVDSSGLDEGETAQGADWILLKGCMCNIITDCLSSDSTSSQTVRNSELLLKYLTCLIEQDLQHIVHHHHHIQEIWSRPLLLRILWSPSYHVVLNNKCRELLDLMSEVMICLRTNVPSEQKGKWLKILKTIVWLVAMATECSRLSEGGAPEGLAALQCEKTLAFVHELAQRITTADMTDPIVLQVVFTSLQLPWQCVGLSQQLLNNMDDYLLADEQVRDLSKITLSHIVSRYFFLLPKFNVRTDHVNRRPDSPAKIQRNLIHSKKTACLGESNTSSSENIAKLTGKVNKKNSKGETPLHTACIKNDINKLKLLLKTPGVDVNMQDNAGWTPLHEACNHGNIQCVQELLKFVPAKTMEHYFMKDKVVLRKVDLLAKTEEGITPLHDAVLNNRTEVCRMLLQHGGNKLLSAVTCLNYTPLQLAETEEMHSLLSSYLPRVRRVSDSQEFSFSQDSMMSLDETRCDMPPDHLYEEVTINGDTRIFADKHAMFTYIYLVTCLLKNYIKAIDAETIREKIREKINQARSRHRLFVDSCSENRGSSQESQSSQQEFQPSSQTDYPLSSQESEPFTRTENKPFNLSQGDESSDKENKRFPFTEKNNSAPLISHGETITPKKPSELKPDIVDSRISKSYVRGIKKDLRVLKGLQRHVEMFQTHLERIYAKDDTLWIETELLEIHVLLDNFMS